VRALTLALLVLAAGAPAAPAQLLTPEDNVELAQSLAEATAEQDVCYGWQIQIRDASGPDALDAGSSLGPGRPLDLTNPRCARSVELVGEVVWTSELSESEDSAYYEIRSTLEKPPTPGELDALGYGPERLLDEADDEALANIVGALPVIVADHGEARPVAFAPGDLPPDQAGKPTGDTGNDFLREHGSLFWLSLLLLVGGLTWLVMSLTGAGEAARRRMSRQLLD
jgi:hypothetical protein